MHDVVIVGGGIASAAAAYFAARIGRDVTLIDAETHRASDLPLALINPLRGRLGRLVPQGIAGARCTFGLIARLVADGHRVAHGRGVWRPLIGAVTERLDRAAWELLLPHDFRFEWHARAPASLGLAECVPALWLAEAGWVAPRGLCAALIAASGASSIRAEVVEISPPLAGGSRCVTLARQGHLVARTLLWCGGAWGAARLVAACGAISVDETPAYKPGSLAITAGALSDAPLTFGTYTAPFECDGVTRGVLGPTREPARRDFSIAAPDGDAVAQLAARAAHVFARPIEICDTWRGVRLDRIAPSLSEALRGTERITALGSRGFLMAPLFASQWARCIAT